VDSQHDIVRLETLPPYYTWNVKYFTINRYGMSCVESSSDKIIGPQVEIIDLTKGKCVKILDENLLLFQIDFEFQSQQTSLKFQAPSIQILHLVCQRIEERITFYSSKSKDEKIELMNKSRSVAA
jgi:hypothetical protein